MMSRCVTCFAGFLSWFRNGLLATGIGVIAFVQSEVGREAAHGNARITVFSAAHMDCVVVAQGRGRDKIRSASKYGVSSLEYFLLTFFFFLFFFFTLFVFLSYIAKGHMIRHQPYKL